MTERILVAIPTIAERGDAHLEAAKSFHDHTPLPCDIFVSWRKGGWCDGLNEAWENRDGQDYFVCASDDMRATEGWWEPLAEYLGYGLYPAPTVESPEVTSYGGFHEELPDGTPTSMSTFPVLKMEWLEHVFPLPERFHFYGDNVIADRLTKVGIRCVAVASSRIVHLADNRGRKTRNDDVYRYASL